MKVVKKTADYTVYQKRSERYAVRNQDNAWINGDEKITILLAEGLIKTSVPKPAEAEPVADEAAGDEQEAAADEGAEAASEEAPAEDSAAEEAPAEDSPEGE